MNDELIKQIKEFENKVDKGYLNFKNNISNLYVYKDNEHIENFIESIKEIIKIMNDLNYDCLLKDKNEQNILSKNEIIEKKENDELLHKFKLKM